MQIGIGIIVIAVIIFFIARKKQSRTLISQQKSKNDEKDWFTVTTEGSKNNMLQLTVRLNEKEFKKRIKDGTLLNDKSKHETTIEDLAGFYGSKEYSPNKNFCVTFCDGHFENEEWKNGRLALIKDMTLLFKKEIQRPNDGFVNNDGFVICCDRQNSNELTGTFLIFDKAGEQIFSERTSANLGTCAISNDSKFALFETYNSDTEDSNSIFVVDIKQKEIIHKFQRPASFNSASIDTDKKLIKLKDHRGFIFEVNFSGQQTNRDVYEKQIMNRGSLLDRLSLYFEKPDEVKFKDENYLKLLTKALGDSNASYSFGKDRIYRMIGEYYEANGDTKLTIENWNKAMQINPKIGVKRKLDNLKRKA